MTPAFPWWTLIPYAVPAFLMAVLLYAALVRGIIGACIAPESENILWQGLCRRTDWLMRWTRAITPLYLGPAWLPFAAVFWIGLARFLFHIAMAEAGLAPGVGG